jgi:hypothetical protein
MTEQEANLHSEREKIKKFYLDQLSLLKVQKEHDQLILDIEEISLKRLLVKQKVAEIKAPNPKDDKLNFKSNQDGNSEPSQESH